ncbi:MAG: LicD family protein [Lachnospiraceae bacterium]|nr:LicD family protein [Lachnospiraceae bacterium]MCI9602568.1 LicD family protein [Lachnospiraceae bacterium]
MLEKFDEICRKYSLTYYVYYGTLLGAVRHQGFIPWDDDIDVIMFRDDYERFQTIAPDEFTEPYFFQNSYTDRVMWPLSKIRDSRTTAAEPQFRHLGSSFHQGIFIDIFPFDNVKDGVNPQFETIEQIQQLLWLSIVNPEAIIKAMEEGQKLYLGTDFLINYLQKNVQEKFKIFESFNCSCPEQSKKVNYLINEMYPDEVSYKSVEKDWFHDIIYLPFEHLQIPAPAEYDKILTQCYGNYHQFVQGGSAHEDIVLEPDIPYKEYFMKNSL